MKIIFEDKNSRYESEMEDIEEVFFAVRSGCMAMGFHPDTVERWFPEND